MTREERNRQSAMNRVYQNCPEVHESINGTFQNGDMWAVCDSYRFIRSKNRPQDIPESMGMDLDTVIPCDAKMAVSFTCQPFPKSKNTSMHTVLQGYEIPA